MLTHFLRWWVWLTLVKLRGTCSKKWLFRLKFWTDLVICCLKRTISLPGTVSDKSINHFRSDNSDNYINIFDTAWFCYGLVGWIAIWWNTLVFPFSLSKGPENTEYSFVLGGVCEWWQLIFLLSPWHFLQNTKELLHTQSGCQAARSYRKRYCST